MSWRRTTPLALVLVASLLVGHGVVEPAGASERLLYVAPGSSDSNPGTKAEPFGTLEHALEQLQAGETLLVRGGTYRERIRNVEMPIADEHAPTQVLAYPGERPVVKGLLRVRGGAHWEMSGINVTWDHASGSSGEHMVKVTNGTDWVFRDGEIWGAQSYAGMLVAGTRSGEPARWELTGNCIHDTVPSNNRNQDHNLYVNTGLDAGPGLIEGNLFFGAPNGMNIKLGPSGSEGGTANVLVRRNTLYDAAQNLLIARDSVDNHVERNILGKAGPNYGTVRGYYLTNATNVARDNIGFDAEHLILNYRGGEGVVDGGGNQFPLNPRFDGTSSCEEFVPGASETDGHGHLGASTNEGDDAPDMPRAEDEPQGDKDAGDKEPEQDKPSYRTGDPDAHPFRDLGSSVHEGAVAALYEAGVIQGLSDTTFGPRNPVTRAQAASLLVRMRAHLGQPLPIVNPRDAGFLDVAGPPHGGNIAALAARGIVAGTSTTTYSPSASITRAQLATVLVRAYEDATGTSVPAAHQTFSDTAGSVHADNIARAASLGLVEGVDGERFLPQRPIQRDQVASVLHRLETLFAER